MTVFEAGEKLWEHTAKAIKILEGASATRVPSPEEIANGWRSNVEVAQLLAAPRPQRYSVNVYDRAGEYARRPCTDFATVLETAKALREKYPGKVVLAFNLDRCDYNTDGLTEDEAEALNDEAQHLCLRVKRQGDEMTVPTTTQMLVLRVGRVPHPVASLADASRLWERIRDEEGFASSDAPAVVVEAGQRTFRVSYNGRIWDGERLAYAPRVVP